jgi:hypothetical protein
MKYIPLIISIIFISCVSSQQLRYKDKSYYGKSELIKTLYMFPISSISYYTSVKNYVQDSLNKSILSITDSLIKYFNIEYSSLSNKLYNKKKISILNKPILNLSSNDSFACFSTKIFNKNINQDINFYIPNKSLLDSLNIKCNYIFRFSELILFKTTTKFHVPLLAILPMGPLSTPMWWSTNGEYPSFGLSGKYILWDYDNSRAICAGEFENNLNTCNIDNANILDNLHKLIRIYLDKTPFWSIQTYEEERENINDYYNYH